MNDVKPPETATATEYVVLFKDVVAVPVTQASVTPNSQMWREIGKSSARSADAAIREVVGNLAEADRKGTFVAIPARSFKPVTVSEKVERTLVIS